MRASSIVYFLFAAMVTAIPMALRGLVDREVLVWSVASIPVLLLGSALGGWAFRPRPSAIPSVNHSGGLIAPGGGADRPRAGRVTQQRRWNPFPALCFMPSTRVRSLTRAHCDDWRLQNDREAPRRPFARTYQVLGMIIAFSLCLVKRPLAVWQVEPDRFSGHLLAYRSSLPSTRVRSLTRAHCDDWRRLCRPGVRRLLRRIRHRRHRGRDRRRTSSPRCATGAVPIYEPGLDKLVAENVAAGRLRVHRRPGRGGAWAPRRYSSPSARPRGAATAMPISPMSMPPPNRSPRALTGYAVIVTKSTVPVGTGRRIAEIVRASPAGSRVRRRVQPRIPARRQRHRRLHAPGPRGDRRREPSARARCCASSTGRST